MCASPHACTKSPVVGSVDKSAAMGRAAPRKKANGEAAMRRCRSGTRKDRRSASCWKMRSTASLRPGRTSHFPRSLRGSFCRQACPFCWDASYSGPRTGASRVFTWRLATLCTSEEPVARLASPCPVSDLWSASAFLPVRLLSLRARSQPIAPRCAGRAPRRRCRPRARRRERARGWARSPP